MAQPVRLAAVKRLTALLLLAAACHGTPSTSGGKAPEAPASGSSPPVAAASSSPATLPAATQVALDAELHFKSGERAVADGITFTVTMLPKLIVDAPVHEIEQVQIECVKGATRGFVHLDTLNKSGEFEGAVFELGYADVYRDDISLTIRRGRAVRQPPAVP